MKKYLLTILFLIIFIPYKVLAYGDLSCYGDLNSNDETTLKPGDTITLNMGVSGYSDTQYVTDAEFSFTFDPTVFELIKDTSNNYLKVYNKWETYKNTDTKVDDSNEKVSFSIGTSNKNNYFFDTSDSLIFAKVQFKVKDSAPDIYTRISVFDNNESYYTTFVLDEDNSPSEIYDVACHNKSISITIKSPQKDDNNYLKSLSVTNTTLNPTFDPYTTRYSMEVPYTTEKVYIAGTCGGTKCSVKGNGTRTLKVGTNSYDLVVTAEDGSTRTYSISITRAAKDKEMAYLKSLTIEGHHLEPNFNSTTLVYKMPISTDTMTLKIYAICEASSCTIDGDGMVKLTGNESTISLVVKTEDDTKTYTINIEREDTLSNYEPDETSGSGLTTFFWIVFICMLIGAGIYLYKKLGLNIKVSRNPDNKKNNNIDNSWRYRK